MCKLVSSVSTSPIPTPTPVMMPNKQEMFSFDDLDYVMNALCGAWKVKSLILLESPEFSAGYQCLSVACAFRKELCALK